MADVALDFRMNFQSSAQRLVGERARRAQLVAREMPFHVQILDDSLGGILPNDLVLVGARSGVGKTQLVTIIAQEAARARKRVKLFALEAEEDEIERRMKYRRVVQLYREGGMAVPMDSRRLSFGSWYRGKLDDILGRWEQLADEQLMREFPTLQTYYRGSEFTGAEFERLVRAMQDDTDLVILDHLHYVDDEDGMSETQSQKRLVRRIRDCAISLGVPVIVVAHLRKKSSDDKSLVPSLEDFMGSSDIGKNCTKAIMLATARIEKQTEPYLWPTFIAVAKDRMDGHKPYAGIVTFDQRAGHYTGSYSLGRLSHGGDKWERMLKSELPIWATHASNDDSKVAPPPPAQGDLL